MCQRNNISFEATFENQNFVSDFDSVSQCHNSISSDTAIKKYGNRSVRFSIDAIDTNQCANLRSQIMKDGGTSNYIAWYGFSVYFTDSYPNNYDGVESFFQVYRKDENDFMPPLTLNYYGFADSVNGWPRGNYLTVVQSLVSPDSTKSMSPYTEYHYPLDTIKFNKWNDFVIKVKWSNDTTGYIKVWMNDRLVYIYSGVNNYTPNYLRLGLDKMDWRKNWKVSTTGSRVMYMDEFRIGNQSASYIDVFPGGGVTKLPLRDGPVVRPTPSEPTPFTLVNPVRGNVVQIQIPSKRIQRISYEIFDINGYSLMRGSLSLVNGKNYQEINVKHLASGMYFFALQSESGLTVKKFIK